MNVQALPMNRFIDQHGQVVKPLPEWADVTTLKKFYRDMVVARTYDNKAVALQRTGKLGTYSFSSWRRSLWYCHRSRNETPGCIRPILSRYACYVGSRNRYGKNLQYWGGDERGSDFTFENSEIECRDLPYCVPIATQCTHAVGVASALKIAGDHNAALVTCGDGATSKGDFLESINCAGTWNIPLVFVVNNNQWAISVPRALQCAADFLSEKANGAGIPGITVDGNDVVAMYDAVQTALHRARKGKGATLIEAVSYRLSDHTTADDATRYRSKDELNQAWQYEPIKRLKTYLTEQGHWSEEDEQTLLESAKVEVEKAVERYLNLSPSGT